MVLSKMRLLCFLVPLLALYVPLSRMYPAFARRRLSFPHANLGTSNGSRNDKQYSLVHALEDKQPDLTSYASLQRQQFTTL